MDHHCPLLTKIHELERTLLRTIVVVVVVVALLTKRDDVDMAGGGGGEDDDEGGGVFMFKRGWFGALLDVRWLIPLH